MNSGDGSVTFCFYFVLLICHTSSVWVRDLPIRFLQESSWLQKCDTAEFTCVHPTLHFHPVLSESDLGAQLQLQIYVVPLRCNPGITPGVPARWECGRLNDFTLLSTLVYHLLCKLWVWAGEGSLLGLTYHPRPRSFLFISAPSASMRTRLLFQARTLLPHSVPYEELIFLRNSAH